MFHGSNDALTHHSSACVIERVNVRVFLLLR